MVSPISGNLPAQPVQGQIALPTAAGQADPTTRSSDTPAENANTSSTVSNSSDAQLDQKLSETLKSTGYKAEVDTSDPSITVVRIMDNVTGKQVVQMPSANALAIAEALKKAALTQNPVESGSLLDEAA